MPTDQEVLDAIDSLTHSSRGVNEIADALGTDDTAALGAQLLELAKRGEVWMVATWWLSDASDNEMSFEYTVRRGTVDDDMENVTT